MGEALTSTTLAVIVAVQVGVAMLAQTRPGIGGRGSGPVQQGHAITIWRMELFVDRRHYVAVLALSSCLFCDMAGWSRTINSQQGMFKLLSIQVRINRLDCSEYQQCQICTAVYL